MSLYQKYRPKTLDEVMGNEDTVSSLKAMLSDVNSCPHSFLLHGQTGCGKTTIGRIIAKELNCSDNDYKEIDTADFRGIDTVREVIRNSQYRPIEGDVRVWLIDETHKMTNDAQNALLKILEDTPGHVYFILATTDPQKLIPTIKGRCSQFQVNPLNERQMHRLLRNIVKAEEDKITKSVYDEIIESSLGSPRNAIQILEQVLSTDPERRIEVARKTAEERSQSIELCRALIDGSPWKKIQGILKGLKDEDAEGIRRHVLAYCESVLLNNKNDAAARVIEEFWEPLYNIGFPGLVYSAYAIIKNTK